VSRIALSNVVHSERLEVACGGVSLLRDAMVEPDAGVRSHGAYSPGLRRLAGATY
jgi:hypothetical protein